MMFTYWWQQRSPRVRRKQKTRVIAPKYWICMFWPIERLEPMMSSSMRQLWGGGDFNSRMVGGDCLIMNRSSRVFYKHMIDMRSSGPGACCRCCIVTFHREVDPRSIDGRNTIIISVPLSRSSPSIFTGCRFPCSLCSKK